jgi:hypothetical protein
MIKNERKKTHEMVERSKSIIMLNYNDRKKRNALEKKIDSKQRAAEKIVEKEMRLRQQKIKKQLEKMEAVRQKKVNQDKYDQKENQN